MGQAKRRGTFDERQQQSIARAEVERMEHQRKVEADRIERQRQAQEWWDSLTPEEQEAEREKRRKRKYGSRMVAPFVFTALACAVVGSSFAPIPGRRGL